MGKSKEFDGIKIFLQSSPIDFILCFMKIQIDLHTLERAEERGTSKEEILDVINTGISIPAKYNRLAKAKIYEFNQIRLNKYYRHKRVEVFYTIEDDIVITVTVYVFYGEWEVK